MEADILTRVDRMSMATVAVNSRGALACRGKRSTGRSKALPLALVHWMRNKLKELIMTVLLEPKSMRRGYFNSTGVWRLLDEHFRGRLNHSGAIWGFLIFELWHRNFLDRIRNSVGAESSRVGSVTGNPG